MRPPAMVLQLHGIKERVSLFVGAVLVLTIGPPVGAVVGSTVLWEAIDRGFAGGLVESGKELSGFIFARCIPLLERLTKPYARLRDDSHRACSMWKIRKPLAASGACAGLMCAS